MLAFLSARANGRDSSQASVLSHAQAAAEAGRILQGNKAGHALMTSNAILVLKFPTPQSLILDEAALVVTLAMRPVVSSVQAYPADQVGSVHALAVVVPAPYSEYLLLEGSFAVQREF